MSSFTETFNPLCNYSIIHPETPISSPVRMSQMNEDALRAVMGGDDVFGQEVAQVGRRVRAAAIRFRRNYKTSLVL